MNRRLLVLASLAAVLPPAVAGAPPEQCLRLERRIEDLRLKLRQGYTARQGRLWRTQLAGLDREYRALCR